MKTPITFYWTTSNDMKSEQNSGKAIHTYDGCVCVCGASVWSVATFWEPKQRA